MPIQFSLISNTLAVAQDFYTDPIDRNNIPINLCSRPEVITKTTTVLYIVKLFLSWLTTNFKFKCPNTIPIYVVQDSEKLETVYKDDLCFSEDEVILNYSITFRSVVFKIFNKFYNSKSELKNDIAEFILFLFKCDTLGYAEMRIEQIKQSRLDPQVNRNQEFFHLLFTQVGLGPFIIAIKNLFLFSTKQNMKQFVYYLEQSSRQNLQSLLSLYASTQILQADQSTEANILVRIWLMWQAVFMKILWLQIPPPIQMAEIIISVTNSPHMPIGVKAELLSLPEEKYVATKYSDIHVDTTCIIYNQVEKGFAQALQACLIDLTADLQNLSSQEFSKELPAKFKLKMLAKKYRIALTNDAQLITDMMRRINPYDQAAPLFLYRVIDRFVKINTNAFHGENSKGYTLLLSTLKYLNDTGEFKLADSLLNSLNGWRSLDYKQQHLIIDLLKRLKDYPLSVQLLDHVEEILDQKPIFKQVSDINKKRVTFTI